MAATCPRCEGKTYHPQPLVFSGMKGELMACVVCNETGEVSEELDALYRLSSQKQRDALDSVASWSGCNVCTGIGCELCDGKGRIRNLTASQILDFFL